MIDKQKIEVLLNQCRSDNPDLQVSAIIELDQAKIYTAVPVIVKLLTSSDPVVRSTASSALGFLGIQTIETVGPALMNMLNDPEIIVRSEAIESLGALCYFPAVEPIKILLGNDPDPLIRASAAEALGDIGDKGALPVLEQSVCESDEAVRAYSANSIGLLGSAQNLSKLAENLEAENSLRVKAELLGARYRLGASEDIESLLNLLDKADEPLATPILNLLIDLIERKQPPTIKQDKLRIQKILTSLAQRLTIVRFHAEEVIELLIEKT